MSTQVMDGRAERTPRGVPSFPTARLALLGCGNVGSELVRLLHHAPHLALRVDRALVRGIHGRETGLDVRFTTSAETVLTDGPDVVVELLGGCEPARGLVVDALTRGIPVVTANKSLLARHGRELREAANHAGVPLLYEAAVVAGVPFLGTFARRPLAAHARGLSGIVNGTGNFVLTQSARSGIEAAEALRQAQARGYAEPNPENDVNGTDAVEKLAVLLQHFAALDAGVESIERVGITNISAGHHRMAADLGGAIKPVIHADWTDGLEAFAGPAFVPAAHPLHGVDDVENALLLDTSRGRLLFQGPGAGAAVTAATVIDDVLEAVKGVAVGGPHELATTTSRSPDSGWFIALAGTRIPPNRELAEYLSSYGIYIRRTADTHTRTGRDQQGFLTWPASRPAVEAALAGLERAEPVTPVACRALEACR